MHDLLGMVDIWDAINDVVVASGGSAGNTSTARQNAVVKVERAIAALVRREVERARTDGREACAKVCHEIRARGEQGGS